jgi:transposase
MISFGSNQRYWLYSGVTDMRKSFDGLCGIVRRELDSDPQCGEVFVFVNRRRDRIKLLVWDRSGFVLYYKRLESGTFELPLSPSAQASVCLPWEQLVLILEGVSLQSVRRRRRYAS